jgi:hypothetical protein
VSGSNPLTAALAQAGQQRDPFAIAKNVLDLRQLQANQAIGGILQQATDANGNVDYGKAQSLAAQAGPVVQSGMQTMLANNSQLRGQQIVQGVARNTAVNNAIVGALSGDDAGLHDRVVGGFKSLVANGVMTQDDATKSALGLPSDPTQLRQRLLQIQTSLAPPDLQQEQLQGTRPIISTPQGTYAPTLPPVRSGGNVTIPHGPTPGQTVEAVIPMDDQGVIPQDANGNPTRTVKTWQKVPVPVQQVPGMPQGGPPVYTPPAGSNAPPPPPGNGTIRSPGAYVTPGGNVPTSTGTSAGGKVAPPAPGQQSQNVSPAGPSNAQIASADSSFVPSTAPVAALPSGAVASDVAAIQGGMANAQATPTAGTQTAQNLYGPVLRSAPPPGYTERLKQDQDQYAADQANLSNRYTNVQNLNTALDALKLTNTGRSTGAVHNFYSFLSSQGIAPNFVDNDVTQYDIARKAMMAFAASRVSGSAAGTDLARVQSELSNASPEISQAAALHVLKQNLGLENMAIAANLQHEDKSGAGYGDSKSQFYQKYDPRAFAWDAYDPDERGRIQAEAEKNGTIDKLRASVKKAMDLGLVHPPAQSSEAAPASNGTPAPASNPLLAAASNAPANALAA